MTVQIALSSNAYTSTRFEHVIDGFRGRMREGFAFLITRGGEGVVVSTTAQDEVLAREIVAALEADADA